MAQIKNQPITEELLNSPRVLGLKKRSKKCICKYCGNQVRLKQITFGAIGEPKIELYCENCRKIEYGIEPEIYQLSKYFVEKFKYDYYDELDETAQKDRMNIAMVSEIIFWGLNNLGYADMEGLKYPTEMPKELLGESIVIDLDDDGELGKVTLESEA